MNKRTNFLIALAIAGHLLAREEYTRNFDKTVALAAGSRLQVAHELGEVLIRTHQRPEVIVHAVIRASAADMAEARRYADNIRIDVRSVGSGLLIETQYPKQEESGFFRHRNISYSAGLDITMPETSPLEVKNSFGAVTVTDLKSSSIITNSHGKLTFRNGRGSQRLENTFAGIEVTGNAGDIMLVNNNGPVEISDIGGSVNLKNRFGKVTLSRIKGNAVVNSGNGDIEAENVGGTAELNTSFGLVRFTDIGGQLTVRAGNGTVRGNKAGGSVYIRNSFGPVEVSDVRKGFTVESANGSVKASDLKSSASVKTSFGPVVLNGVEGKVDIEDQNGSVDVTIERQQPCNPVRIQTSFGAVRVRIPSDASYSVSASTSFGQIHSDFPVLVQGSIGRDSLTGKIGSGTCDLHLMDTNGNIAITKQ